MRVAIICLTFMLPMGSVSHAHDSHDLANNSKDLVTIPPRPTARPEVSFNDQLAIDIRKDNISELLPLLFYWGVQGAEWDRTRTQVSKDISAKVTPLDKKKGLWAAKSRNGKLADLKFKEVMVFDKDKGKLNEVRRYFASKVTDREKRLGYYQKLSKELEAKYGSPTHTIQPVMVVGGKDLYSSGGLNGYHVEWHGKATEVSLLLSDDELVINFRKGEAPYPPRITVIGQKK